MTAYLLAHDLGTSGNKATLFTVEGEMINSIVQPYRTDFLTGNRIEQNPEDWWQAVCNCSAKLVRDIAPGDIKAISFSGQMMGCVCIDHNGDLLRNAIIWADQRASMQESMLSSKISEEDFYRITGHRVSASYTLEKAMWIREHQPDVFKRVWKILQPKDYIVYKLTGKIATDYSDASGTNALDINSLQWSDYIFDVAQMDVALFPDVYPSTYVAGTVTSEAAEACGIRKNIPVVIGAGDGVAAAVGSACVEEGKVYNYLGSSSWISYTADKPYFDPDRRTFNWVHAVPDKYAPTGTMQAAGNTFNFIKSLCYGGSDERGRSAEYKQIEREIACSPCGSGGLLFLPYLLGERSPRWDKTAKGGILGITMNSTRGDILRAAIEGIAFNLDIIFRSFPVYEQCESISLLGGLAQSDTVCQILSDTFNKHIDVIENAEEATSIGAAIIAGVGTGEIKDFNSANRFISTGKQIDAIQNNVEKYESLKILFEEYYQAVKMLYQKI